MSIRREMGAEEPAPWIPGYPPCEDYFYDHHGVRTMGMFFDPLRG